MGVQGLSKTFAVGALTTALYTQNAHASDEVDVSGVVRANMKITGQTCQQNLPNLLVKANSGDWNFSSALKVDHLDGGQECFGDHDARLFWVNATYSGFQEYGTTVKLGMMPPNEYTQFPMEKGFTSVQANKNYALYGGIVGAKVMQDLYRDDQSLITANVGLGYKPEWTERFGNPVDHVSFAGVDVSHELSDALFFAAGYEVIRFEDDAMAARKDEYAYASAVYKGEDARYKLFGEKVTGGDHRHSVFLSRMESLSPKTSWEVAAGRSVKGDKAQTTLETSVYHQLADEVRLSVGYGHDFESDDNTARLGAIYSF